MFRAARPAFKDVGIDERHEQLEILVAAIVRRRRHQQEMAGLLADQLSELIALRVLDLIAEQVRRHSVRFIADYEVPIRRGLQFGLQGLGARRHVEAHNKTPALGERIAGNRALDLLATDHIEVEGELLFQFVLPLLDEISGRDDQASFQVAADDQLLDKQARHDCLACAGVVRKHEAKRPLRQHLAINCCDLVRVGIDPRRVHGEVGIEQVSEADALRLRGDLEGLAIGVEGKSSGTALEFKPQFIVPEKDDFARTVRGAVDDVERIRPDPVRAHDLDRGRTGDPPDLRARHDAFEPQHANVLRRNDAKRHSQIDSPAGNSPQLL